MTASEGLYYYSNMGKICWGWEFEGNPILYEIVPQIKKLKIKI